MAIYKNDIVDINLETGSIHRSFLNHTIGSGDEDANRFGIRAFRDRVPQDLSGCSCQAIFMNAQGTNIALTDCGTVSGNEAWVTLPQACYNVEGQFCLSIKLIGGGVTGTMRIVDGVVDNTGTNGTVAPTESVPTYQEIIALYDDMMDATEAANAATAPEFDGDKRYTKHQYVLNDGALYQLPEGHEEDVTWQNTVKIEYTLADGLANAENGLFYLDQSIGGNGYLPNSLFEIGSLIQYAVGQTAKINRSVRTRVTTSEPVSFSRQITVTPAEGYQIFVAYVNSDGEVTSNSGWRSAVTVIQENARCMISLANGSTEENIGATWDLVKRFSANTMLTEIHSIAESVKGLATAEPLISGYCVLEPVFEQGNIGPDGQDTETYYNSRMRSGFTDVSAYNVMIYKINDNFRIYISWFDENKTLIGSRGWLTNTNGFIDVKNAYYIRIVFTKMSDSTTPYATAEDIKYNLETYLSQYEKNGVAKAVQSAKANAAFHSLFMPANSSRYLFAKGKCWEALSNTREAYELAGQDARCWGINGDCQYTYDEKLVMWHDTTITYNGSSVAVSSLTYDQVRSIVLIDGGETYQVPSLDEFIGICRRYGKVCNIELKGQAAAWSWSSNGKTDLLDEIVQKLNEMGMQDSSFIDCTATDIQYIRTNHNIACCRLWDANVTSASINSLKDDPQIIQGGYAASWIEQDTMKIAHAAGQKTLVYTTRPQTQAIIETARSANGDIIGIEIDPDQ